VGPGRLSPGSTVKIGVIYYSGTGTTAYTGQKIAEKLEEKGHSVSLGRMNTWDPEKLNGFDILGFGAPCYAFYPPRQFLSFLRKITPGNIPFFLFSTSHGMGGNTAACMYRIVAAKGYRYLGCSLECTGILNIRAWRRKKGRNSIDEKLCGLENLSRFTHQIAERYIPVSEEKALYSERGNVLYDLVGIFFTYSWQMALVEGFFKRVDLAKCTGCGICAEVICPAGAITLNEDRVPKIRNTACKGCSGCVNLCPEGAISTILNRNRQPCTVYRKALFFQGRKSG